MAGRIRDADLAAQRALLESKVIDTGFASYQQAEAVFSKRKLQPQTNKNVQHHSERYFKSRRAFEGFTDTIYRNVHDNSVRACGRRLKIPVAEKVSRKPSRVIRPGRAGSPGPVSISVTEAKSASAVPSRLTAPPRRSPSPAPFGARSPGGAKGVGRRLTSAPEILKHFQKDDLKTLFGNIAQLEDFYIPRPVHNDEDNEDEDDDSEADDSSSSDDEAETLAGALNAGNSASTSAQSIASIEPVEGDDLVPGLVVTPAPIDTPAPDSDPTTVVEPELEPKLEPEPEPKPEPKPELEPAAAAETSAAETSAADTPATETSAADTHVAETSAADTPAADTPAADTPAAETPAADTPAPDSTPAVTPAAPGSIELGVNYPSTPANCAASAMASADRSNKRKKSSDDSTLENTIGGRAEDYGQGEASVPDALSALPERRKSSRNETEVVLDDDHPRKRRRSSVDSGSGGSGASGSKIRRSSYRDSDRDSDRDRRSSGSGRAKREREDDDGGRSSKDSAEVTPSRPRGDKSDTASLRRRESRHDEQSASKEPKNKETKGCTTSVPPAASKEPKDMGDKSDIASPSRRSRRESRREEQSASKEPKYKEKKGFTTSVSPAGRKVPLLALPGSSPRTGRSPRSLAPPSPRSLAPASPIVPTTTVVSAKSTTTAIMGTGTLRPVPTPPPYHNIDVPKLRRRSLGAKATGLKSGTGAKLLSTPPQLPSRSRTTRGESSPRQKRSPDKANSRSRNSNSNSSSTARSSGSVTPLSAGSGRQSADTGRQSADTRNVTPASGAGGASGKSGKSGKDRVGEWLRLEPSDRDMFAKGKKDRAVALRDKPGKELAAAEEFAMHVALELVKCHSLEVAPKENGRFQKSRKPKRGSGTADYDKFDTLPGGIKASVETWQYLEKKCLKSPNLDEADKQKAALYDVIRHKVKAILNLRGFTLKCSTKSKTGDYLSSAVLSDAAKMKNGFQGAIVASQLWRHSASFTKKEGFDVPESVDGLHLHSPLLLVAEAIVDMVSAVNAWSGTANRPSSGGGEAA